MDAKNIKLLNEAKNAALEVLLHNAMGPFNGLPRTAGWGYPEPYTRDLMFSILGIASTENKVLLESVRRVLKTLAQNQTQRGLIPNLVHDKNDLGSSDTTPLFLFGLGIFRLKMNEPDFLKNEADKAMIWMEFQSPDDQFLVAQQPTSDWRDEQWVLGYGLYVNTLVYGYLCLFNQSERAKKLKEAIARFTTTSDIMNKHVHEGLALKSKPYFACWSYKVLSSERFDLLGNSLAILTGIASPGRSQAIILWVEEECKMMMKAGILEVNMPPNLFPFIQPIDKDWQYRDTIFNQPGHYHNGGIWPFISAIYIAALVAVKEYKLAESKLLILSGLVKKSRIEPVEYGFNEWIKPQNGKPMGQDWQTWSASLYLYASQCVDEKRTPFFDVIREISCKNTKV